MHSSSSKKIKRKLSIIFRDPNEIPHRKGTLISQVISIYRD